MITSSPILGPDRKNKNDNLSNSGYSYEQEEILNFIKKQKNLFIVNGDRHWQYVTHIKNTKLWEFGCGGSQCPCGDETEDLDLTPLGLKVVFRGYGKQREGTQHKICAPRCKWPTGE